MGVLELLSRACGGPVGMHWVGVKKDLSGVVIGCWWAGCPHVNAPQWVLIVDGRRRTDEHWSGECEETIGNVDGSYRHNESRPLHLFQPAILTHSQTRNNFLQLVFLNIWNVSHLTEGSR